MSARLHWAGCGWFWAWAAVGAGYGLCISVIGAFTIIPAVLATVYLARRDPVVGAWGVATGVGSVFLFIAYLHQNGESFNPMHWLIVGLVFFVGGMVGHVLTRPQ